MISIISIADGVLRDRAAALKLEKGRLCVVGAHRSYDAATHAEVDADSSAFEIGAARWMDGAWEAYPAPTIDTRNADSYRALMLRRVAQLEKAGDKLGALLIRSELGG